MRQALAKLKVGLGVVWAVLAVGQLSWVVWGVRDSQLLKFGIWSAAIGVFGALISLLPDQNEDASEEKDKIEEKSEVAKPQVEKPAARSETPRKGSSQGEAIAARSAKEWVDGKEQKEVPQQLVRVRATPKSILKKPAVAPEHTGN